MNSVEEIWKKRLEEHTKEVQSYLKYMLNDHLLIVVVFMLGGGAVWYSQWLKAIPEGFPAIWIMAAVFGLAITASSVRTLLKEADIVFLLPLEKKMEAYFKQAFPYSFFSQLYMLILPAVVFAPLYFAVQHAGGLDYLWVFLQLLIIKGFNMQVSWLSSFTESSKGLEAVIRYVLNALLAYFILSGHWLFALPLYAVLLLLVFYFNRASKGKGLKWERLISQENAKKQSFYRLANLFTDVPKLKKQARRRKYLDWVLSAVKYSQAHSYHYMFARAFVRGTDYFGIFARLTVITALILLFFSPNMTGAVLVVLCALFLTGIQIIALYKHFDLLMLPELYPVSLQDKKKGFYHVLQNVLLIQAAVLGIVLLAAGKWAEGGLGLAAGIVFTFIFVQGYVRARVAK
ncbi:ABC transporter permease [Metabacillus sp. GX 13764]|uniref:ABC transporter permease n=1 Tax=Metabacillus kandeliae TaxID=2900151 RepID=UPI001E29278F|nr:ABC transporter permease [Metabacillus kandeliae]MCD7034864.1 ABC transporter permease [Metabacillus kandeliae]